MSSLNETGSAESQRANNEGSELDGASADQNTVQGGATNGGLIFQGGKHEIHLTQNFGVQSPAKDLNSPFTNEKIDIDESFEPETILIPEGPFWMGSNPGEGVSIHEMPQHEVTLPVYRIGKFPVTNAQYEQYVRLQEKPVAPVLGWNGRRVPDGQEDNPVMGVTLDDAKGYCKWLSEITKRKYELPNEAQLEKAYKGLYGCSDIIDSIYLWTCALWGEKGSAPDSKYRRNPWKKDDGRNNPNANSQLRRVVCRYQKLEGDNTWRLYGLTGQLPSEPGLSGARHSFRVVMNV